MNSTPKTDKIIKLIEELFHTSNHKEFLQSKDTFSKADMVQICDLVCEASFVIGAVDAIRESLEAIETSKLGELDK